ncbi:FKBP-type peptidyl-prolyl cis-trans isomerase SlyD [Arcticibacter svalbardensis MN12-7]|uniref:Peptidyl-prolyl cis-trans isomerase n=1 Tax=Arcticibacter svalbardensis MN12-7 TaxID=1150600 RepID=R9H642_9SPHI|nr:peptidylprolyl isomerase [Arcticibacter svalbardensis]EOR96619.1 FKBP-type peptidyl-prolyl cis-trans isomerase SlyD [Arcticibacter svalbardensis MN12-7]
MKIQSNSVVALTYDLYTTENGEEVFVEKATEEQPLVFLYGVGMMLPKFEENLSGLGTGDAYDFHLAAVDAYGEKNESSITELPADMFEGMDKPEIGSVLPLQDNEGNQFRARVIGVTETGIQVDLNHPMAGQHLHFKGQIINVREATEEELSHGHVHGADGHEAH